MGSINPFARAPAPAPLPPLEPISAAPQPAQEEASPSAEEQQATNRRNSLLRRGRGRLGTILSGFRGILSPSNNNDGRKSLLGE